MKPQFWKTDPNLLVNSYIKALETHYNKNKKALLIRSDNTKRPYLAVSALRDALRMNVDLLKSSVDDINKFVEKVNKYNMSLVNQFRIDFTQPNGKDEKIKERMISIGFTLAYDLRMRWVKELLA